MIWVTKDEEGWWDSLHGVCLFHVKSYDYQSLVSHIRFLMNDPWVKHNPQNECYNRELKVVLKYSIPNNCGEMSIFFFDLEVLIHWRDSGVSTIWHLHPKVERMKVKVSVSRKTIKDYRGSTVHLIPINRVETFIICTDDATSGFGGELCPTRYIRPVLLRGGV